MSVPAAATPMTGALRAMSKFWWIWLVAGIFWVIVSLAVLQFDQASITTVGVLIGIMFIITAFQQFLVGALMQSGWRWFFYAMGVLFIAAGVISLIRPKNTFVGVADILGYLFLLVGTFWLIEAFVERDYNPVWWLTLIAGILMVILAFWTSGQFFITKAYTLLIFAGIWALMQGVTDIVRAFQIRSLRDLPPVEEEAPRATPATPGAVAAP
ncbi:MAG: HdeD family acid-resistance protein [Thermoleophilaceae bacterium]